MADLQSPGGAKSPAGKSPAARSQASGAPTSRSDGQTQPSEASGTRGTHSGPDSPRSKHSKASKISRGSRKTSALDTLSETLKYLRSNREMVTHGSNYITVEQESRLGVWIDEDDMQMLLEEERQQKILRDWIRFDCFFGLLIALNGLMLGLTTDGRIDENSLLAEYVELGFLIVFTLEWLIRWCLNPTGIRGMLKDPWMCFDLTIISVSLVAMVLQNLGSFPGGAAVITALRVVRLARLLRLVRLLKFLKEFWILVSGLQASLKILGWSVLMLLLMCYIFGLFMFELIRQSDNWGSDPLLEEYFGGMFQCMVTMLELATHSGAHIARDLAMEHLHPWVLALLLAFISVASLGILHLIIGVLLTSTLQLASSGDNYTEVIERVINHRALRDLRLAILWKCRAGEPKWLQGGLTSPMVVHEQLMEWHKEEVDLTRETQEEEYVSEMTPQAASTMQAATSGMRSSLATSLGYGEVNTMASFFEAASITEDDIKVIFNEVASVHGKHKEISVDDFIEGCMWVKGQVHPLDVASMASALASMHSRLTGLQDGLGTASVQLSQCSTALKPILNTLNTRGTGQAKEDDEVNVGDQDQAPTEKKKGAIHKDGAMGEQEKRIAKEHQDKAMEAERWDRFDQVFSVVIFTNAVVLGMEVITTPANERDITSAKFDSMSMVWFIIEIFFFIVYCTEVFLRAIFLYQMKKCNDFRVWWYAFPKMMWFLDFPLLLKIIMFFPHAIRDRFYLFDITLVTVAAIDNLCLRFIKQEEILSQVLRIMGLLRLLRLGRLLHLIRPLHTIVSGFFTSMKLIFWSMVMLTGIIYMCAIAMVDMVGHDDSMLDNETIQRYWGHLGDAMMTFMGMATYSHWGDRIEEVGVYFWWMYPFGLFFMSLASLGILNLVTGMMVQAAFHIVMKEGTMRENVRISAVRAVLQETISHAFKKVASEQRKDKNQLRLNVMEFVHEEKTLKEKKLADQQEEAGKKRKGGKTPNAARMRQAEMASVEEDGEAEPEEDLAPLAVSVYDAANSCSCRNAIWLSGDRVGVVADLREDGFMTQQMKFAGGPTAMLFWQGGQAVATHHLVDPAAAEAENEKKEERKRDKKDQSVTTRIVLIFSQVKRDVHLNFRFANHCSSQELSITTPLDDASLNARLEQNLKLLDKLDYKVDNTKITETELDIVLQDPNLNKRLQSVSLRPDQVLMTYSALDVMHNGYVRVEDLIEGVIRLKRPVGGIDVARAKSVMRRLLMEFHEVSEKANKCFKCFQHVVETLRDVNIRQDAEETHKVDLPTIAPSLMGSHDGRVEMNMTPRVPGDNEQIGALQIHRKNLEESNKKLEVQVSRLRRYVIAEREKLELSATEKIFTIGKYESDSESDVEVADENGIQSADEGWE